MNKIHIGFLGAGGIARAHAWTLQSMKYFYDKLPEPVFESVASASKESRKKFAEKYDFASAQSAEEFLQNKKTNAVFILASNNVHSSYLKPALEIIILHKITTRLSTSCSRYNHHS
jgi:predicted dehydrogenase